MNLEEIVAKKRNSLKTDRLDMSFGELMNMFEDGDLFIAPEYQRAFRWSMFQQTRFIESVILGIPIPPIFVAEDDEGKWEIVDGLQRISTIFAFFGALEILPDKNHSVLTQGEMVKELEGLKIEDLPIKLKTTIKRAICRVEIVRWDSKEDIRYELFNRLNTGSSPLSHQEVRNCIFRAYPVDINSVLRDIAKREDFIDLIGASEKKQEEMFLEELVLRYFAFKYLGEDFKNPVDQFLTEFMKQVSKGELGFDVEHEKTELINLIELLYKNIGKELFRPKGKFAQHLFDSLAYVIPKNFNTISGNEDKIVEAIKKLKDDAIYNEIGTNYYSNVRMKERMERAKEIFSATHLN